MHNETVEVVVFDDQVSSLTPDQLDLAPSTEALIEYESEDGGEAESGAEAGN